MQEYHQLPCSFRDLLSHKPLRKVPLVESVRRNIFLLLTTHLGEYRYDPTFGCVVWEHDFELVYTLSSWQHRIEDLIKTSIQAHEPRLSEPQVRVQIAEEEWQQQESIPGSTISAAKKRINVSVSGKLKATNEQVDYPDFILFFSPVSMD